MKKLFKYLKKYKKQTVLAPLFKLFEVVLELSVPFIVSYLIDSGIKGGDKSVITFCSVLMCAFAFIGLGFALTAQYFAAKAATGFASNLRAALFSHIQKLSFSDIDKLGVSSLITNITSDVNQVQNGLNLTLRLLLRSPFVVFGAIAACFFIDVRSAAAFSCAMPVLLAVIYFILIFGTKLYSKVQKRLARAILRIRENLNGVRVLRAFGREKEETEAFNEDNAALVKSQLVSGRISALLNPLTYVIINVAVIALMQSGAVQVNGGRLTTGEVVAMYNLTAMVIVELIKLADYTINLTKAISSADRVSAVLDTGSTASYGEKDVEYKNDTAVRLKDVSLSYGGGDALEDIDIEIKDGQTVGVIGGTGSGKTSLISVIAGYYGAQKGSVELYGVDIKEYPKKQLEKTVSAVPQKAVLFSGTVRENMLFGAGDVSDDEIYEALSCACAYDFVMEKGGLDCRVEQGGRNFSGGQKQRLTVARTILRKPKILILDDSSSALDFATDAKMRENLGKMRGITVINAAQRISSVRGCDMIITLDDGKLAGVGTHAELLANCPTYRRICESQTEGGAETV